LKCWGDNSAGQLGNGSLPGNNNASGPDRPVDLGVGRTAKAVAAGWNVTCVLRDNDSVACWGNNVTGAIGNGGSDGLVLAPSDVNLGAGRTAAAVVTGLGHACARLDDRSLKCWGANHHGQVGLGAGAGSQVLAPGAAVDFGAGRTVAAAALGGWHSCAVLDDATLRCWGDNSQGQLGLAVDAGAGLPSPSAPVTLPF
jgi:alpha-tubulin suppressor-like RCC1 family protein